MDLLLRLLLTVLLAPLFLVLGAFPSFLWEGYEGPGSEAASQRKKAAEVAKWMAAHPVEAARIEREKQRRMVQEMEYRAKLASEAKEAEEKKRREARLAIETALAIPLSEKKVKLLSEMQFPPSLADLERFARPDD